MSKILGVSIVAEKSLADALTTKLETVTASISLTEMMCSGTLGGAVVFHD